MRSFNLLSDATIVAEDFDADHARVLQKLQHGLAQNLGLNVSLRSIINFFIHKNLPSEDDEAIRTKFKDLGYDFNGGYDENRHFWEPLLSRDEYFKLLPQHIPSHEDEESILPYDGAIDTNPNIEFEDNEQERVRGGGLRDFIRKRAGDYLAKKAINFDPPSSLEKLTRMAGYQPRELTPDEERQAHDTLTARLRRSGVENEEYGTVTPEDYQQWERVIRDEANDRNVNLTNKHSFEDLAFYVLDNDPKIDMLGGDDQTKRKIIRQLWLQYRNAPTAPVSQENEESHRAAEYEGRAAALDMYNRMTRHVPKNPHAKGTHHHAQWEKGFNTTEQGMWSGRGYEDEEHFDLPNDKQLKTFKLMWKDGRTENIAGADVADAFEKAGYNAGKVRELDHFKEVKDSPPTS